MNLLCCTIEDWVQWTTIIANILTLITIIPIIFALITYCKNRVCKKSFKLVDIRIGKSTVTPLAYDAVAREVRFCFYNQTNKIFYISMCAIEYEGMPRQTALLKKISETENKYEFQYNQCVAPNAPCIIEGIFLTPKGLQLPQSIDLLIQLTSKKIFQYKIDTVSLSEIKDKTAK